MQIISHIKERRRVFNQNPWRNGWLFRYSAYSIVHNKCAKGRGFPADEVFRRKAGQGKIEILKHFSGSLLKDNKVWSLTMTMNEAAVTTRKTNFTGNGFEGVIMNSFGILPPVHSFCQCFPILSLQISSPRNGD